MITIFQMRRYNLVAFRNYLKSWFIPHSHDDPFRKHLCQLIKYKLVPYGKLDDFKNDHINRCQMALIAILLMIVMLNLARFILIATLSANRFVREYLVEYFFEQINIVYFYIGLLTLQLTPSFLIVNFIWLNFQQKSKIIFQLFFSLFERQNFDLSQNDIARLRFGMRAHFAFLRIAQIGIPVAICTLAVLDFALHLPRFNTPILMLAIFWNAILIVASRQMIAVSILLLQQTNFIAHYYKLRLRTIQRTLSTNLAAISTAFRTIKRECENRHRTDDGDDRLRRSRLRRARFVALLARSRLNHSIIQLIEICCKFFHFCQLYRFMAIVSYYGIMAFIELYLYLLFDYRTAVTLRAIAICFVTFLFVISYGTFLHMCQINVQSKRMLTQIDQCLHRSFVNHNNDHDCDDDDDDNGDNHDDKYRNRKNNNNSNNNKYRQRFTGCAPMFDIKRKQFMLCETRRMISQDTIAVKMGDVFSMTRFAILKSIFAIIPNVFLIININR